MKEQTLWLTRAPNGMRTLKAIRAALRALTDNDDFELEDAQERLDALRRDGFAQLSTADPVRVNDARDLLEDAGCQTKVDLDPETISAEEPPAPPATEPAFSDRARDTVVVLLSVSDGNPILAAARSSMLARSTGDDQLFYECIAYLMHVHPWLAKHLEGLPTDGP